MQLSFTIVAKAHVQCLTSGGYYACSFCEIEGVYTDLRSVCYSSQQEHPERSATSYLGHAGIAKYSSIPVNFCT